MAHRTEVGLGPGYTVLDWDPAPLPKKGAEPPPNFQLISIVAVVCPGSPIVHVDYSGSPVVSAD